MTPIRLPTHSGDSHLTEPDNLWMHLLKVADAARLPLYRWLDDTTQVITVDGQQFHRVLPIAAQRDEGRPVLRGMTDLDGRLADMDAEGVVAEVAYLSGAPWVQRVRDAELLGRACAAMNEWLAERVVAHAPGRLVPAALLPVRDPASAAAEVDHIAELGLSLVELPCDPALDLPSWNDPVWEPMWDRIAACGLVVGIHAVGDNPTVTAKGRGAVLANYAMTAHVAQRAVAVLVASGVLDRRPGLRLLVSEAGAGWVPHLAERLEEGRWSQAPLIDLTLDRSPVEICFSQVYATFQHETLAVASTAAAGYDKTLFGTDYPHHEGTWGHTQETLLRLDRTVSASASERVRLGAFNELFPHVDRPEAP